MSLTLCLPSLAGAVLLLPGRPIFEGPLADPRGPRCAAGRLSQSRGGGASGNAAYADFAGYFGLLEGDARPGRWQLGVEGGMFTIWDMGTESWDFVNADFLAGLPLSWRRGPFSAQARLYHVSSHLGDEFLLHNRVERRNFSFEAADLRAGWDVGAWRVYGGGGYLYRRFPIELRPWRTQAGLEYSRGPTFAGGRLRPVAGLDLQQRQENGWGRLDVSLKAGLQVEGSRRLQILFQYYRGRDPNGQFYGRTVQQAGAGVHLYF
jgi:hypothetical protein